MAKDKPGALEIKTFADHHVITQPNPLQNVLRRVAEKDLDDPVARAEKARSEEHTSELQSQSNLVCRLLLEKKKKKTQVRVELATLTCPATRDEETLHV